MSFNADIFSKNYKRNFHTLLVILLEKEEHSSYSSRKFPTEVMFNNCYLHFTDCCLLMWMTITARLFL